MKIAIIAAMSKELDLILAHLERVQEIDYSLVKVYIGQICGHEIVACQCGIGKVNSALRSSHLIKLFLPDLVINTGVAGGLDSSMRIGSILVGTRTAYHDVWCPGNDYGAVDGMPVYYEAAPAALKVLEDMASENKHDIRFGLICSGDKFISSPEEVVEIKSHFPDGLGCDMESASIAQTCYIYDKPFIAIRVMSDMPGDGHNISEYKNFWIDAPVKTFEVVNELIKRL